MARIATRRRYLHRTLVSSDEASFIEEDLRGVAVKIRHLDPPIILLTFISTIQDKVCPHVAPHPYFDGTVCHLHLGEGLREYCQFLAWIQ